MSLDLMASLSTAALAHSGKIPPLFAVADMDIADRNEPEGAAWGSYPSRGQGDHCPGRIRYASHGVEWGVTLRYDHPPNTLARPLRGRARWTSMLMPDGRAAEAAATT